MRKPVIGISSKLDKHYDMEHIYEMTGQNTYYVESIIKSGAIPILLPVIKDEQLCEELLNLLDGIIFSGGHDISPQIYDEEPLAKIGAIDFKRDYSDVMMLKAAKQKKLPILGICRGEQLINAVFGGTLCQDIPSYSEDSRILHSQHSFPEHGVHIINIVEDTYLSQIYGATKTAYVNSLHHQCVKELAPDFRISAYSNDKIIEAIEYTKDQFIMGVQWHPEMMFENDENTRKLFEFFVDIVNSTINK